MLGAAALGARLGGPAGALIGALVGHALTNATTPKLSLAEHGLQPHDASDELARWIRANYPYRDPLTPLKLQSLAFYCFGIALAYDLEGPIAGISFEPWSHGPVCRPLWARFGARPAVPLSVLPAPLAPMFERELEALLLDVLTVYGSLETWRLQQQVRLEAPYLQAYAARMSPIPRESLRVHFRLRYREGRVVPPAYLFDGGSFAIDGLPVHAFRDIHDLARALRS